MILSIQSKEMSVMNSEMQMVLVLGATGGIGGAVARKLLGRGWRIPALNRDAAKASRREPAFEWLQAMR